MTAAFFALAFTGFREALRNRITLVLAIFTVALLASTSLVAEVTVATIPRVVTDLGLGGMALLLSMLAIFLSASQLSREIERRTLFLTVTKPISRGMFLAGRFAGVMLTLSALLVAMALLFFGQLALLHVPVTPAAVVAVGMLFFELLVLCSIGFALGSVSGQLVAALMTASAFVVGHLSSDLYRLSLKAASPLMKGFAKASYYLAPHLHELNFRSQATYGATPAWGELAHAAAYGLAYSAVMLSIAVWAFSRRDFR